MSKFAPKCVWEYEFCGTSIYVEHGSYSDEKDRNYHGWIGGCGIGGKSKIFEKTKKHCLEYAIKHMEARKQDLCDSLADAHNSIKFMKKLLEKSQ